MMMLRPAILALALSLLFAPTTVFADDPPEYRVTELFEVLAATLTDHSDCDAVEDALRDWTTTNHDELSQLADKTRTSPSPLDTDQLNELDARLGPAMHTIFSASMACGEHEGTMDAMDAIDRLVNTDEPHARDESPAH